MEVIRCLEEMRAFSEAAERPVGLVPTMGYLHEGHLSLVRRAREECAAVAVSIFVNPLQFGPAEDLDRYPRDEERDLGLARGSGVDAVFSPSAEDMYPEGFATEIRLPGLEDILEGASRPGHFSGVATVLAKLLNVVGPDRMYLGRKDAQQAVVARRMMRDIGFAASLVVCPTVREPGGLALSSRNVYLSEEEREAATAIPCALYAATEESRTHAEESPTGLAESLCWRAREKLAREDLIQVDYVSADDAESLGAVTEGTRTILLSCSVKLGTTRLIDNVVVEAERGTVLESPLS